MDNTEQSAAAHRVRHGNDSSESPSAPTTSANPQQGDHEPKTSEQPASLLFVDDEKNILRALRRLFRPLGYTIHLAESGQAGLDILQAEPVDLIISDMRMPGMDGAQFLEAAARDYPEAIRILLTGGADLDSTVAAINQGKIYRYISKPWEDTEITLTVRQALHTKQLQREKERLTVLVQEKNNELLALNASLEDKVRLRTEQIRAAASKLDAAYKTLAESYEHTIQVISNVIGHRENLSGRVATQVADLARAMALALQRPDEEVRAVYFAGLLHEVGKLSLPDNLLDKPVSDMSAASRTKYRQHTIHGQNALMAIEALEETGRLIRSQEEHFDGQGYPDHLSGNEIPLGARLIAIARDYFDCQGGTPWQQPLDEQHALAHIRHFAGTQYDPRLVAILERIVGADDAGQLAASERVCSVQDLEPGMRLSRDVFNAADLLLLSKDRTLTAAHISHLRQVASLENRSYQFHVYRGD